jgi:hypothetical protein
VSGKERYVEWQRIAIYEDEMKDPAVGEKF